MGFSMHTAIFKTPRGALKIICLLLVIVDLVLSRIAFTGEVVSLVLDHQWLNITSVCAYAFILPIIIILYILGDDVPVRGEILFQLLGTILFIASGSNIIGRYNVTGFGDKDVGLALGSMEIITGAVMLIDFALLAKDYFGKKMNDFNAF